MSSFNQVTFLLKYVFIHICILLLTLNVPCQCLSLKHSTCEKIGVCQCVFPVGMGIDLSKLKDLIKPLPWLSGNSKDNNSIFYFEPCTNIIHSGDNECSTGAALCVYDKVKKQYTLLGKTEESSFSSETETSPVYLKYLHNNITSTILLTCSFSGNVLQDTGSTPTEYKLTLSSPSACPDKMDPKIPSDAVDHSLSAGSVLVIIFATFSAIYLLGGALILKLTRGAEGKELIPNYDFWAELPNLVRDGVMFLLSGCQAAATYDRI